MSISTVTSETLQAKLRELLPSQQGFGTDISASDTIIPVIDLTGAAEGTDVPIQLQEAFSFGSQNAFTSLIAGTTTVINTTGFYRVKYYVYIDNVAATTQEFTIRLNDGATTKTIGHFQKSATVTTFNLIDEFTLFLGAGDSLEVVNVGTAFKVYGSYRQIADVNGNLVNPVGFTPQ